MTGRLRHMVTLIYSPLSHCYPSPNLGKQFYQGQNFGFEWSVVKVLIFAPVTNSLLCPLPSESSQQQASSSRGHKKHQDKNWAPVKRTSCEDGFATWFDHLVKSFSHKKVQFEQKVLPTCDNLLKTFIKTPENTEQMGIIGYHPQCQI